MKKQNKYKFIIVLKNGHKIRCDYIGREETPKNISEELIRQFNSSELEWIGIPRIKNRGRFSIKKEDISFFKVSRKIWPF